MTERKSDEDRISLRKAIQDQDLDLLLSLKVDSNNDSPVSIESDYRESIKLNRYDKNETSIMLSSHLGHIDCIRTIINKGVDLFRLHVVYKRSLLLTAHGNHEDCVHLLARHALFPIQINNMDLRQTVEAIECQDFNRVQDLLSRFGCDMMKRGDESNVMNLLMLHSGPVECLKSIIEYGAPIDQPDRHGLTPLAAAVISGKIEYVHFLLEKGADTNSRDSKKHYSQFELKSTYDYYGKRNQKDDIVYGNGKTALMFAAVLGRVDCADVLLKNGADANISDEGGFTALMHAAYHTNSDCFRTIITSAQKLDIDKVDKRKQSALIHAAYSGDELSVKLLLKAHAKRYNVDLNKRNAFMAATFSNSTECALFLLKDQVEVLKKDVNGKTTISYAAEQGDLKLLRQIIKKVQNPYYIRKYDVDVVYNYPVFHAVSSGRIECVKFLIENGADVNFRNNNGETPLMHACERNYSDLFFLLVKHGADIKAVSEESNENLLIWALKSDLKVFEYLLKNRVKVQQREQHGRTPLIVACMRGKFAHAKLLIDFGAVLDVRDTLERRTALMYAAVKEHVDCFKLLLDAGANCDLSSYSQTILSMIVNCQNCELLDILVEKGKLFDKNELKKDHLEALRCTEVYRYSHLIMMSLMKHGVFLWSWYPHGTYKNRLPFSIVMGGISPGLFKDVTRSQFWSRGSESPELVAYKKVNKLSPLTSALLTGQLKVVCYLLSNCYFTMDDYRTIIIDVEFQKLVRKYIYHANEHYYSSDCRFDRFPNFPTVFDNLTTKPLSLQFLSLLVVSSCITSNGQNVRVASRAEQVNSLPIPEIFKRRLKFQGPLAKLCPEYWHCIAEGPPGWEEYQDLLSLSKPLYPYPECLVPCDNRNCSCDGLGMAVRI